ncbi:hypothetical protein M409DRAFT_29347 [Zasmidium cellare ATCC 36951]|uniref:Uncharacterized protein n=1 Tax=Zasmidium cellare ATCC 36951 TaxID=1080233 RepID=A0A6A6C1V0_ZASCE|nr:uncharacterized protein M409DRAFT_29347 [Zasmidium cellare ATCC 36951]KAF2160258.1 hypothetical protein M409DRAFT_29347 [Zasmidium cellare ATCC 36951]
MSLPRQDSFFKIAIPDCGPQGVPPSPDGHVYDIKELAQPIETTTFTVDATSDIAKTWLAWLKNLGDENAAWVRELAITVRGGVEVRVRISPPLIRREVSRAKVEVSGDVQNQERLHGDLVKWLNRAVEDVREKRLLLHGGGEFSRKEIHKIAKVAFRVPAVCHELTMRYERGEGLGSGGEGEKNEESAIEDSDEEMDLGGLISACGGGGQKEKVEKKKKKPKSLAQVKKEAFINDDLAFREHARSCSTCECKWVDSLDGVSEVYAHRVARSGGRMNLVFAKCGTTIDVSCTTIAKATTTAAKETLPSNTRPQ